MQEINLNEQYKKRILDSFVDILENYYPLAKQSLLELETKERIKALGAFTDLRDVFDHLYLALKYAQSLELPDAEKKTLLENNISSAYEHLRRATIEPFETAVEDILAKIIEKAKCNLVFYFFGISKISNKEILESLMNAFHVLSEIRQIKGQLGQLPIILDKLKSQYDQLFILEKKLPSKTSRKIISLMIMSFLIGILSGGIIYKLIY